MVRFEVGVLCMVRFEVGVYMYGQPSWVCLFPPLAIGKSVQSAASYLNHEL